MPAHAEHVELGVDPLAAYDGPHLLVEVSDEIDRGSARDFHGHAASATPHLRDRKPRLSSLWTTPSHGSQEATPDPAARGLDQTRRIWLPPCRVLMSGPTLGAEECPCLTRRARRAPPIAPSTSTPSGGRTTPSPTRSTTSWAGRACRSTWGWPTWSGSATCSASTTCTTPRGSRPSAASRHPSGTRSSRRSARSTAAGTTSPTRRWGWPAPVSVATCRSRTPGPTPRTCSSPTRAR